MTELQTRRKARRDRIRDYLNSGHSHRMAMANFGMTRDSFYAALSQIKLENPDFQSEFELKTSEPTALDPGSLKARARLGQLLWSYRDNLGNRRDRSLVAEQTGVTPRAQARAEAPPYNHDWSFSQIARLAAILEISFETLMKRVTD